MRSCLIALVLACVPRGEPTALPEDPDIAPMKPPGAPTAVAEAVPRAEVDEPVTLDGSMSSDPDGDILTFSWRQTAGPDVALSTPEVEVASFLSAVPSVYIFELTVDDGGLRDTDVVEIEILDKPNKPPIAMIDAPSIVDANTQVTRTLHVLQELNPVVHGCARPPWVAHG